MGGCGGKKKVARANQLYHFGTQKLADGNAEAAVAELTQASKLDPKNAEIRHSLGLAYWAKSRVLGDDSLKTEAEKQILESFELRGGSQVPGSTRRRSPTPTARCACSRASAWRS